MNNVMADSGRLVNVGIVLAGRAALAKAFCARSRPHPVAARSAAPGSLTLTC